MPAKNFASDIVVTGASEFKSSVQCDSYLDMTKHELRNAQVQNLAAAPASPVLGQIYYDTVLKAIGSWSGSYWQYYSFGDMMKAVYDADGDDIVDNAEALQGNDGAYYKNRANHTGTQLASTISNFDTQVRTSRLDQMAAPTLDVTLNTHKITNLGDPSSGKDAVNVDYVTNALAGLINKASCRVATSSPLAVSGSTATTLTLTSALTALDGVTLGANDRILVKDQSTGSQNGLYFYVDSMHLTRCSDADINAEVKGGLYTFINEGAVNGDNGFTLTTNDPITLGSSALTFVQTTGAGQVVAGNGLTKNGNQLDVNPDAQSIEIVSDAVQVKLDAAGAISKSASGIKVNVDGVKITIVGNQLTIPSAYSAKKVIATITGNSSTTTFTLTHNLGTKDFIAKMYNTTTNLEEDAVFEHFDTNNLKVYFNPAPATGTNYNVIMIG